MKNYMYTAFIATLVISGTNFIMTKDIVIHNKIDKPIDALIIYTRNGRIHSLRAGEDGIGKIRIEPGQKGSLSRPEEKRNADRDVFIHIPEKRYVSDPSRVLEYQQAMPIRNTPTQARRNVGSYISEIYVGRDKKGNLDTYLLESTWRKAHESAKKPTMRRESSNKELGIELTDIPFNKAVVVEGPSLTKEISPPSVAIAINQKPVAAEETSELQGSEEEVVFLPKPKKTKSLSEVQKPEIKNRLTSSAFLDRLTT